MIFFALLLSFSISGREEAEYFILDDKRDFVENTLNLNLRNKNFSLFLKGLHSFQPDVDDYNFILRRRLSAEFKNFGFEAGDIYSTYLSGLFIRFHRDREYRIDKVLSGVSISYENNLFEVSGIAGRPSNLRYRNYEYFISNDTLNTIIGTDLKVKVKNQQFELAYLRMRDRDDPGEGTFTELYGGGLDWNFPYANIFMDYIHKGGCRPLVGGEYSGNGIFGGVSFYYSSFGMQLFYINYDSIGLGEGEYRYNDPEVINRSEISINRGEDEEGYGVIMDYTLGKIYAEAHVSKIGVHVGEGEVVDNFFRIQYDLGSFRKIILDYEYLSQKTIDPHWNLKNEHKSNLSFQGSYGNLGVEMTGEGTLIWADSLFYYEGGMEINCSTGPFTLSGTYIRRSRVIEELSDRKSWRKIEMKYRAGQNLNVGLMVGEERGGLICSGGVCRWVIPFRGLRLNVEKRF